MTHEEFTRRLYGRTNYLVYALFYTRLTNRSGCPQNIRLHWRIDERLDDRLRGLWE